MEFLTVCNFTLVSNQNLKVDDLNLQEIGPKFEHHEMFPARTNTGLWRLMVYISLSYLEFISLTVVFQFFAFYLQSLWKFCHVLI